MCFVFTEMQKVSHKLNSKNIGINFYQTIAIIELLTFYEPIAIIMLLVIRKHVSQYEWAMVNIVLFETVTFVA